VRRPTRLDALLLGALLPVWLAGVVLHVDRLTSDLPLAWFPAYLAPASSTHPPVVVGLWPDVPLRPDGLRVGDVLLEVRSPDDARSLRNATRLEVIQAAYLAARDVDGERVVTFGVERDGERRPARLPLRLVPYPESQLFLSIGIGLSGILVLWRGQGRRAPRAYALAAIAYALHFCSLYGGQPWQTAVGYGLLIATAGLYPPLLLRAALLFPPSAAPRSRAGLRWPWLLAAGAPAAYLWLLGSPKAGYGSFTPLSLVFAATIAGLIVVLVRNYRLADPRGRRQMRWGFYGMVVGTLPPMLFAALASADPSLRPLYEISLTAQLVLPFCLFVALVHDRLFDIDRLISETATLTLLGIVPVAVLLSIGVRLSRWVGETTGIQESTALGVLVVGLLGPLPFANRRIAPWIHLRLFPERMRFEADMRTLRRDLGACSSSEELFATLGKRLGEAVPLESLAVYVPIRDVLASAFAHGPLVPPAFARDGRLLGLVADSEGPVSKTEWRRWARKGLLDDAERAGLEGLSAEWVVPALRGDAVEALVCVGPKTSGDIFTAWESALLEGVAERAAIQLDRFDDADRARREQRLIEELRRYVPATVERVLADGARPEAGEHEVSIFFVDVRGSTAWAEARSDAEVFEMMGRFTREAAEIVERHGGTVVEFAGDGFMAVFGAGGEETGKERAAIEAGRGILASVRGGLLPVELLPARPIGVGIATGTAYVGDVSIGSHVIWTALGDTANLAARLESLTKELGAVIVVDERTRRGAADGAADFTALGKVEIRGRGQPVRLYALSA
jgi:class 3 adenylate cyclase